MVQPPEFRLLGRRWREGWSGPQRGKKTKDNKNKNKSSVSTNATTSEKDSAQPDSAWLVILDPKLPTTGVIDAFVAHNGNIPELYHSGMSQHLSPCCERFLNFISISPKPIRGADNRTFHAIGRGDLPIYLPNGDTRSRVLLQDVLYAPSMHVMLVSISRLTAVGCQAVFDSGLCQIFNMDYRLLGQVHMANGLYKTQCNYSMTAVTVRGGEKLTMEELHCHLFHIRVDAGKRHDDWCDARPGPQLNGSVCCLQVWEGDMCANWEGL